jgi:hypothetical protein
LLGVALRQRFDAQAIGGMKPAQKLMQRAEHLRGEAGRDLGLRGAARLQERRQAPLRRVVVQTERRQQELNATEHRPSADLDQRAQRERDPAARFAARGVDEPKVVVGYEEANRRLFLAQEALEPLMRRRLPARERAPLVRLYPPRLDAHEDLPAAAGIDDRPIQRDLGVAILDLEDKVFRERVPTRRAGDLRRPPAERAMKESPGVFEGAGIGSLCASVIRLRRNESAHGLGVGARLDFRGESVTRKHDRGDDETHRLDMAKPFVVGVDPGHAQLPSGQR